MPTTYIDLKKEVISLWSYQNNLVSPNESYCKDLVMAMIKYCCKATDYSDPKITAIYELIKNEFIGEKLIELTK